MKYKQSNGMQYKHGTLVHHLQFGYVWHNRIFNGGTIGSMTRVREDMSTVYIQ